MFSQNKFEKHVHNKWPVLALVKSENGIEKVVIVDFSEGKTLQTILPNNNSFVNNPEFAAKGKSNDLFLRSIFWHDELLILCICYNNGFEIWSLDHDKEYMRLLDEGLEAPSFDFEMREYYEQVCNLTNVGDELFNKRDLFGINEKKRLRFLWEMRYKNLKFSLFKRIEISSNENYKSIILSGNWIDYDKLIFNSVCVDNNNSNIINSGFISIWKTSIEIFSIDVYNEIRSRRYDKSRSKCDFNDTDTNSAKIEIMTNIDTKPILNKEFSFDNDSLNNVMNVLLDASERFIITYKKMDSKLYIWRYEQISYNIEYSKNSDSDNNINNMFSKLFQYQKISLNEKIISVNWKNNTIPTNVKKNGGINDISIFTTISKSESEIYVRIWRESSLDKPCVFFQSIFLRFYDDLKSDHDFISVVWEDEYRNSAFRRSFINNFEHLNSIDDHYYSLLGLKDNNESYYYSSDRFKLYDEDDILDYYYNNVNNSIGENSDKQDYLPNTTACLNSFIPLNMCIHDENVLMNDEKQEKELRIMVTIGSKYYYFKVLQLNVWNDQLHPSISRVYFDQNNNSLPLERFKVLSFWRNNDFYYRNRKRIYEFLIVTQDYDVANYTLDEDNRRWYFTKYIKYNITPDFYFIKNNTHTLDAISDADNNINAKSSKFQFGKSAIELYCMNKILLLTNNCELILVNSNFNIEKKFYSIHAISSNNGTNKKKMHVDENMRDALDNELFLNLYENNTNYDNTVKLIDLRIEDILYISHPISRSYYSFILAKCNSGAKLRIIGLNGLKAVGLIRLELINVYVEPVSTERQINNGEFDNIRQKHEKILSYLFEPNINGSNDSKNSILKYEVSKISKYRKSNYLDDIYICIVKDYETNVSHLIFFKVKLMFKRNTLISVNDNIIIGITVIPPINGRNNQFNLKSDFEIVNMDNIDHQLIFISSEIHSNYCEKNSELNTNQLYINVCELLLCEFEIVGVNLISEIMLNKSDCDKNLRIKILDYNILIYNPNKQVLVCYSLISLNMLTNFDDDSENSVKRLVLNPFQEIGVLNGNSGTNKNRLNNLFLYLDFDGTYKCILTYENTSNTVTIYWNRDICKWEFKCSNVNEHCVDMELINLQKLDLFDTLLFFYNNKLLPDIYNKDKNKSYYEDSNNYSFHKISVLEDFIFSLNDKKQYFSKKLINTIMEHNTCNNSKENNLLPNMNLEPYNIIEKLGYDYIDVGSERGEDHLKISDNNVYRQLHDSLLELLLNNKERNKMSVAEIEEYNIKRYIIKNRYFNSIKPDCILTSEDICWILLCDKDYIIDNMLCDTYGDKAKLIDWNDMRKNGLIYVFPDNNKFQEFIEKWIYKLYQKYIKIVAEKRKELLGSVDCNVNNNCDIDNNEIMNIILVIYTCLDKLNIVSAIFKIIDQKNVFDFLLNYDYDNDELRKQAMRNGYYLIKQRKYYWSICFFILSNSYEEISNVCIKYLNDPQLLMVILKLLINKKSDNVKNYYISIKNILNRQINDIWLLSLENKDPWLSIIALMNYHLLNNVSNTNRESIGICVYNMFINISIPTIFIKICDKRQGILGFYENIKNNGDGELNIEDSICSVFYDDDNVNIVNTNSFDLNYSFIHPEHLMLYNKYIKKKLTNNYYYNTSFKKYSEFKCIIEIICYYIKRCMNPYHYLSWFYYLEENRNVFMNSKYFMYYNTIIKSIIMKKIYKYVYYISVNYYFTDNSIKDNLLTWYKDLIRISSSKSIYGFIKVDNYLTLSSVNDGSYVDMKFKISNIINKLLELVNDGIIIGWENNSAFDLYNLMDVYIELILYYTPSKNDVEARYNILNDIMNLYCLLNNNIKLITNNSKIKQLIKYENIILLIWNRIYLLIIEICDNKDEHNVGVILIKIYIMSLLLQQCLLRIDIGYNNSSNLNEDNNYKIYNLMISISKFIIISNIIIHGLRIIITNSKSVRNKSNNVILLLIILNQYIDNNSSCSSSNFNIKDVVNDKFELSDLEVSSIYIILLTISIKMNQDIVAELNKEQINIKTGNIYNYEYYLSQLISFKRTYIENTKLLLKKYYFNVQFLIWKEYILLFIPMIVCYFKLKLDGDSDHNNNNNSNYILFLNMNEKKIVKNQLFVHLINNIWFNYNINNILLTYILRNQDVISLYNSNSILNIYYNILRESEMNTSGENEDVNVELSDQFSINIIKNENEIKVVPNNCISYFSAENDVNITSSPHLLNVTIYYDKTTASYNNKITRGTYINSFFINDDIYNIDTDMDNGKTNENYSSDGKITIGGDDHNNNNSDADECDELDKKLKNKKKMEANRKYTERISCERVKKNSDIYFSWFIKNNRGSMFDLVYVDYKLLINCTNDSNMPFLVEKGLNNLLLNSKLYYLHPNTFIKKTNISNKNDHNANVGDKILSLTTVSQDSLSSPKPLRNTPGEFNNSDSNLHSSSRHSSYSFISINKDDSEINLYENNILRYNNDVIVNNKRLKLELLLNSILLLKESIKSKRCICDGYCINNNYGNNNNNEYGILSYTSDNRNSSKVGEVDFCLNVRKKIKSIFIRSESCVFNNNENDIEFIQIYTDVPLNFSKIQNQYNVKAIICGEHIQIRKRRIRQIIYPYWCHSFAFNNYNKLNHIGNNLSIPKPIIIKNSNGFGVNNYNHYCNMKNKVIDNITRNTSATSGTVSGTNNNTSIGGDNHSININNTNNNCNIKNHSNILRDNINDTVSNINSSDINSINNKLLIGTINSVNWCPAKINIVLSTSNGYILIYRVNKNMDSHVNCYKYDFHDNNSMEMNDLIDVESVSVSEYIMNNKSASNDELLQKEIKNTLTDSVYDENVNDKLPYFDDCGNNSNCPFIPQIVFQSHKKDCNWSNIIDYSCRYIITHGNGINDCYSSYLGKANNSTILNTGTFNLAEFMGENTPFNFTSNINNTNSSDEKNCFCIWDIWPKDNNKPELLLTLESSLIINTHNWKLPNILIIITLDGILWFISYKYGNRKLLPISFKLPQKNIIDSYHLKTYNNKSNISIMSKLTIISSDGTIMVYNVNSNNNNKLGVYPIIKYSLNQSNYNMSNPLNIINTSFSSSSHLNRIIVNTIFINWNTVLIIDNLHNCKIIKLLPYNI
ncbi:hypothetical protein RS030_81443 [Cryptosporidium xiaoi]|uniref:RAVE complex protein Rav1 C-terminal domain-containing protein n=1 Tax=Cryptosporidium xiaoi TaxID=659607 RepID=A0AAV9XSS7_9CRYT